MNNKKLVELVKAEAANLKKFATKEEIDNLEAKYLDPNDPTSCIYGQCTGSCFSTRAHELIIQCADRVYNQGKIDERNSFKGATLNGKPNVTEGGRFNRHYWSPIELFLSQEKNMDNGNNEAIIAYLKDETQTLEFV